jgi:hypothetical protein
MKSQVRVFGIAWYVQEDYDRSRAMFIDGEVLPRTYHEWKRQVECFRESLVSQGILVVQAYIDPNVFLDWCISNGCQPDSEGRDMFTASLAGRVAIERDRYCE